MRKTQGSTSKSILDGRKDSVRALSMTHGARPGKDIAMPSTQFVALLRGINLGKRRIRMDALRNAFIDMGFADARTLIASGNVVFSAAGAEGLAARIE